MKKSSFLVFFLIFISLDSLYSQMLDDDEPKLIVRDSLSKDKYYVRTYFDKKGKNIQSEGIVLNKEKDSIWNFYDKKGKLKVKCLYLNDIIFEILEQYNSKGIIVKSNYFDNSLIIFDKKDRPLFEIYKPSNDTILIGYKIYKKGSLVLIREQYGMSLIKEYHIGNRNEIYYIKTFEYLKVNDNEYKLNEIIKHHYYKGELAYIYYYNNLGELYKREYYYQNNLINTMGAPQLSHKEKIK